MNDNKFYVYVYFDSRKQGSFKFGEYVFNYEPFYVGKGFGRRWRKHLIEAKNYKDTNKEKCNLIREIWSQGKEPIIIKYKENISNKEAKDFL